MMSPATIAQRLSLRAPQTDSLGILAKVADAIPMKQVLGASTPPDEALACIKKALSLPEDFSFEERTFPTICFSLATAVGKTRLMGACIAYLRAAKDVKNFLILAPNLTIHDKLVSDFTQGSKKYVFSGLGEVFKNPPEIVTADNFATGKGVFGRTFYDQSCIINIFNISKINAEVRANATPRFRAFNEIIGSSYFDYLRGLDDLVILMDESHRYRGDAGLRALCDLNPVLGIEVTATPQIELGSKKQARFKNIVYDYPLSLAMRDGFVKQPAVATRKDFDSKMAEGDIELQKLEDGIHLHEDTKFHLDLYAKENGLVPVKPFMLVVARDIAHATRLQQRLTVELFEGRYAGKVITVHSGPAVEGDEKDDDIVNQLLTVERPDNKVEIVIHVNMLKEGWDVNNLYTIVPIRAAKSRTLVEQSIGRGLRLPYGRKTGNPKVDRLTIVAHDSFDEIIAEAKAKKFDFQQTIMGVDVDTRVGPGKVHRVPSAFEARLGITQPDALPLVGPGTCGSAPPLASPSETVENQNAASAKGSPSVPSGHPPTEAAAVAPLVLNKSELAIIDQVKAAIIEAGSTVKKSSDLADPACQAAIVKKLEGTVLAQQTIDGVAEPVDMAKIASIVTNAYIETTIDVPRILTHPTSEVRFVFKPFTLNTTPFTQNPSVSAIELVMLDTMARDSLSVKDVVQERTVEDHIVSYLMTIKEIDYDTNADLLYELAGQAIAALRSRLAGDEDVRNVVRNNARVYAAQIFMQMKAHMEPTPTTYIVTVGSHMSSWEIPHMGIKDGVEPRHFTRKTESGTDIKGLYFSGFSRCMFQYQRFQSDQERMFAEICEKTTEPVVRWVKPFRMHFPIQMTEGRVYEPDFIVETDTEKLLVEIKKDTDMESAEVLEKAHAGATWCKHATADAKIHGLKPWTYLLIPHSGFGLSASMAGLKAKYAKPEPA